MRAIWNHLRDSGCNAVGGLLGSSPSEPQVAELSVNECNMISHVWRKYGHHSGLELSQMTHEPGTPWSNSYFGVGRNAPWSQSDIKQHFVELALAERTAQLA
jgi:uncharacterized phage-associated protein